MSIKFKPKDSNIANLEELIAENATLKDREESLRKQRENYYLKDEGMYRPFPQIGEIYKHFKGGVYEIVCVAANTENGDIEVVYRALYGGYKFYTRPIGMFLSVTPNYPDDVTQKWRFERIVSANSRETIYS